MNKKRVDQIKENFDLMVFHNQLTDEDLEKINDIIENRAVEIIKSRNNN